MRIKGSPSSNIYTIIQLGLIYYLICSILIFKISSGLDEGEGEESECKVIGNCEECEWDQMEEYYCKETGWMEAIECYIFNTNSTEYTFQPCQLDEVITSTSFWVFEFIMLGCASASGAAVYLRRKTLFDKQLAKVTKRISSGV